MKVGKIAGGVIIVLAALVLLFVALIWSPEEKPAPILPQDYIFAKTSFDGTATKDGADFKLTFTIHVLSEDKWLSIPILPGTVAIKDAKLPKGTFLELVGGKWYHILTKDTGKLEATVSFSVAVKESQGTWTMNFNKAPAGMSKLKLTIKEKGVTAKVPTAQSVLKNETPEFVELKAAIPGQKPVTVTWEKAVAKAKKIPAKLYSECKTLMTVGDGILASHSRLTYQILHTGVRELKIGVAKGANVLDVRGSRLRDWRVVDNTIHIQLGYEALGTYQIELRLEQPMVAGADNIVIPVPKAQGVERDKGFIGIVAVSNVEISTGRVAEASSIDISDLPPEIFAMTNQPILQAYRYLTGKFQIALNIKKHEDVPVLITIADSAFATTMQTSDGRRMTRIVYNVRNNKNQFLRMKVPEGFEIWSTFVSGKSTRPAKDEEGDTLIPLIRSGGTAQAAAAFPVEVVYVEKEAEISPTGRGKLRVELPVVDAPIMHMMWDIYLPAEGKYNKKYFKGPLKPVKEYLDIKTGKPVAGAAQQAMALQQRVTQAVEQQATATGVTPMRAELPLHGQVFHLEKILVLEEPSWVELDYSNIDVK